MEMKILEEKKGRLYVEIPGAGHTVCNAIKEELHADDKVKIATYSIRHPEISNPKMIVETDSGTDPRKAIQAAISRLKKSADKFKKDFNKEVR